MKRESKLYSSLIRYFFIVGCPTVIFVLLFRAINHEEFIETLRIVDIRYLLLAGVCSIIARPFIAALRWRTLLKAFDCTISYAESVYIIWACYPVESVVPFKMGRLSRFVYLKKQNRISLTAGGVIEAINFALSLLGLVVIIAIGAISVLLNGGGTDLHAFVVMLPVRDIVKEKMIKLKKALLHVPEIHKGAVVFVMLCTLLMHILHVVAFCIIGKSVGVSIPLSVALVFIPMIMVIANIPITIAGLGTREACVLFFFSAYASNELLLATGVLFSLVWIILPNLIGLLFGFSFFNNLSKK